MFRITLRCLLTATIAVNMATHATAAVPLQVNPETGETQARFAQRTAWWRDAKFGMFIHWGIYAVPNSDHANSVGLGEWYLYNNKMQVADYERFASRFDPTEFDARQWVATAKAAGMKYIVITAKHHDGFCMFDTKLTDYNVVKATPWHHDPMKDLAAECKRQGIKLCFYYSFMDWHHPDYLPRRDWDTRPVDGANLDRYCDYVKGQLRELLTQYGPIGGIWFDGHWEHDAKQEHAAEIVKLIRSLQPDIMINDRLNLPEDYDTPEQNIPGGALPNGRLWETCMTINGHWGYAWNDTDFKSSTALVRNLCDVVSKGGNFLLNVGPDSRGVIPEEEVARLNEVGHWLKSNGPSIYGAERSPFKVLPYPGRCTIKGDTLYLQAFEWPAGGLALSSLKTPVTGARVLGTGEKLNTEPAEGGGTWIQQPDFLNSKVTVVAVKLGGPFAIDADATVAKPQPDGTYILSADSADLHGNSLHLETADGISDIGYWHGLDDSPSWTVTVPSSAAGMYRVSMEMSCLDVSAGSSFNINAGASKVDGTVAGTGDWDTYHTVTLDGAIALAAGRQPIAVTALSMAKHDVMNLRRIVLTPVPTK
jgi:alpha-L-fucosidase